ncbi:hypothetical protein BB561_004544 [Smittium simulii]|uniref:Uncharacterized protein n=1 Tax=Smittium simulii TaxID=133385 RepID=A0A2T9YFL9_9FUNG|nr:hypothetical protein BB561_004544 [Smittium simulii]
MADSLMDIIASIILVVTSRAAAKTHWLEYPTGRKRLETVGTIIFSTLMATLSTQLIIESVRTLLSSDRTPPKITIANLIIILIALFVKLVLYLYCNSIKSSGAVKTFATDHRNDLLLNSVGLLMGYLSTKVAWYMDPIGGILLALFILSSWSKEAFDNVRLIVGITADPDFLKKLTYTSITHNEKILFVDTVRAYHVGELVYVEVDVVMDPEIPLWLSHDISESLQIKLESLTEVARAFVHVDYDFHHHPEHRPKLD